jgi:hypothetical protein
MSQLRVVDSRFLNSRVLAWVVVPCLILSARIMDASLGTVRTIACASGFATATLSATSSTSLPGSLPKRLCRSREFDLPAMAFFRVITLSLHRA